ncbi:hypothetical protein EYF80_018389 [Liparis tanakae]|uniref:Uncharacterized protein n=1 Tax=Liparis tanakae TaxID=230148 RepID=A0A4Z2I0H6_9TELE|nr:hypothetical protein EYF80_018389 [Liparis tanakae]
MVQTELASPVDVEPPHPWLLSTILALSILSSQVPDRIDGAIAILLQSVQLVRLPQQRVEGLGCAMHCGGVRGDREGRHQAHLLQRGVTARRPVQKVAVLQVLRQTLQHRQRLVEVYLRSQRQKRFPMVALLSLILQGLLPPSALRFCYVQKVTTSLSGAAQFLEFAERALEGGAVLSYQLVTGAQVIQLAGQSLEHPLGQGSVLLSHGAGLIPDQR